MSQAESKTTRSALSYDLLAQEFAQRGLDAVALFVHDSVGSTNDEILAHLPSLPAHSAIVVTADEQVSGRGRLDRVWSSPWAAGIALTIAVDAAHIKGEITSVPLRAGLAVHKALATFGVQVGVKWPNDIVTLDGLKLGGLLSVARENAILIGIGLNTSLTSEELPTPVATSLELLGHHVARENLIAEIVAQVHSAIADANWVESYNQASATLGKHVRLHRKDQPTIEGTVVEFAVDGSIRIATELGDEAFSIGDIEHLRVSE